MSEQQIKDDFELFGRFVDAARGIPGPSGVGNAQISINAGGAAVWMAVTACFATVVAIIVASIFVAITIADLRQNDRELREADMVTQAYLSARPAPAEEEARE